MVSSMYTHIQDMHLYNGTKKSREGDGGIHVLKQCTYVSLFIFSVVPHYIKEMRGGEPGRALTVKYA